MMTFGPDGAAVCVVVAARGGGAAVFKLDGVNCTGAPAARRVGVAGGGGEGSGAASMLISGRGFGSGCG